MNKLIPPLKQTVFGADAGEIATDLLEVGIDSVLDEGLLRDIPIVSVIVGTARVVQGVRDRHLLVQTLEFIGALQEQSIPEDELDRHRRKLDADPEYAEEELGRVLVILDATLDREKSRLLAGLYAALVRERIDWDRFRELTDVVNRMFMADLPTLRAVAAGEVQDTTQCGDAYRADRLSSLGLVELSPKSILPNRMDNFVRLTALGEQLCELTEQVQRPAAAQSGQTEPREKASV